MSRYYETLFIIRPSADDAAVEAAVADTRNHIEAAGGEVLREHNWGKRKLAYEVASFSEGIYAQVNFTCGADYPQSLERMFRLHDDIIRDIVVRTEGPPPEEYPDYLAPPPEEPRRYRDDDRGRDDDRPRDRDRYRDRDDDRDDRPRDRDRDRPREDRPRESAPAAPEEAPTKVEPTSAEDAAPAPAAE